MKTITKNMLILTTLLGTLVLGARAESANQRRKEILNESQVSYRAEGGFSGVASYGVIVSCVKGKISVLKSIYDPRIPETSGRMRQVGTMDKQAYLNMFDSLLKMNVLARKDAPGLERETLEEFTHHFYIKIGKDHHEFNVVAINRPEAASYFAIRNRIDSSVNMSALWATHHALAMKLDNENH